MAEDVARTRQLSVLGAAGLGNVKLLKNLIRAYVRSYRQELRQSRKRERREQKESRRSRNRSTREFEHISEESSEEEEVGEVGDEGYRHTKRVTREKHSQGGRGARAEDDVSPVSFHSESPENSAKQESYRENNGSRFHEPIGRRNVTKWARSNLVNCQDLEGLSPLHHACRAGSEEVVRYLIRKGANVDVQDCKLNTPLHIAAQLGPAPLVPILRNAGADMEARNDEGVTPSDILNKKQASSKRAARAVDPQQWFSHLAEELSEDEDSWWGSHWGEQSERPDWEDPFLERMAESRQGRGIFDEPFSLRDFLKAEKNKKQGDAKKSTRKGRRRDRTTEGGEQVGPEVPGTKRKISNEAQSYSQRWKRFEESYNLCLSYSSVPFPVEEGQESTLGKVLLEGMNPSLHRNVLRKEMLRWHPDKFLQKWGGKLQGPDHDRIVTRVNEISEAIHQLYKTLSLAK